ncbi:phage gp6-like head-tail connector protein [Streptomyces longwoodensis]
MPLATPDDVAARLGRALADDEQPRVLAFITDVTALIEDYCGRDFERHQDQTLTIKAYGGSTLTVPPRYQQDLSVSAVQLSGQALTGWVQDGRDLVLTDALTAWPVGSVTFTASWGFTTVPAALKAVACSEVIRWLSVSPGTVMEKTGDLEVQYAPGAYTQTLSEAAVSMLSKRFRPRLSSIPLTR